MTDRLEALHHSADRLRAFVAGLDDAALSRSAYPTEWTVADVCSHLGSGAVIMERRLQDLLAGVDTPDDAATAVWDEWNAKGPRAQADALLASDSALLERLDGLSDDERAGLRFAMGPMTFDFDGFVGLRLNEHALHVWDIEVSFAPTATVAAESVACIVDNLQMFAQFTGRPVDDARVVTVATTDPARTFRVTAGPDAVGLESTGAVDAPDLTLPAEALVRLVYGRLDPDHTPPVTAPGVLDELRPVFPGA